jgi:NADPH-dependent ferric siderophore reductase
MTETQPAATERGAKRPRTPMATSVHSTRRLTPSMVRIVLSGGDLSRFAPSPHADSYVKLMFLNPTAQYERPIDPERIRATQPPDEWPRLRTYTVRDWDSATQRLTLDVIVHGAAGLGGPWAAGVQVGDEVLVLGPGGGYHPDGSADWHLLIGDDSALPAIAVALERMPSEAIAHVFVEVAGAADEISLTGPVGAVVHWIHREQRAVGVALFDAVAGATWPIGDVQAFVHGEAGMVREFRTLLKRDHGVPAQRLSISGYWRLGADDEAWRAQKADWNRAVEADDGAEQ